MAQDAGEEEDDIVELSPFIVEASGTASYTTSETLAGTRIRTDVRDLAASISTVTEAFLEDTGTTNAEDLLVYTPGTETGGLEGNFSGLGNNGNLQEELVAPHTNNRVRGLSSADNTRNFFRTDIPWDAYNTDAVTVQRGPNSVLFGVAGPAGIVNSSLKRAAFEDRYEYENMIDMFGRFRNTLDLNKEIIDDQLALRLIALDDDEEFRQEQAYRNASRYFGSLRFSPQLLKGDNAPMNIELTSETGKIRANTPRFTPPNDRISAFFDPEKLNGEVFHPQAAWKWGIQMDRGTRINEDYPENWQPWVGQQMPGIIGRNPVFIVDNATGAVTGFQQMSANSTGGINEEGAIDDTIEGFDSMIRLNSVAGYNEFSQNMQGGYPGSFPGATTFWKDRVVTDPSVFDFYHNLLDGDNKREWTDFDAYSVSLSQTFLKNRAGLEFFYDFQDLTRGGETFYSNTLTMDINTHLFVGDTGSGSILSSWDREGLEPNEQPDLSTVSGGVPNPNVGRALVSGRGGASELDRQRENHRLTAYYKLNASDFLDSDSLLTRILGSHTFTGLAQRDTVEDSSRNWRPFAMDTDWIEANPGMDMNINGYDRQATYMMYVSDDLRGANPASGLGITPVRGRFQPSGSRTVGYFSAVWDSEVDPAAEWIRPLDGEALTQSENPDNYVGWTTGTFNVLNAEAGDISSLYTSGSRTLNEIDSTGITWQGRLLDGLLIPTWGYREDEVTTIGAVAPEIDTATKVVNPFFDLVGTEDNTTVAEGETETWGLVLRSPASVNERLGIVDDFTLFYGESENFSAENRVGFDARRLPNSSGSSTDYGITLSMLDGKVSVKATWYESSQTDAAIPGGQPLGNNQWYLANNIVWQIGHALKMEAWRRGENFGGYEWYYNYAWVDDGYVEYGLPEEGFDHPSLKAQEAMIQAVYDNLMPQEWYDAYGYPIDVAKLKSSDWATRKQGITDPSFGPNTSNNPVAIQPSGGGLINGLSPTGTVDQNSEGFELEVNAQLRDNWNVYLNVVKTEASRGKLGESFATFLEDLKAYYDGPAGDIRQWWAGDRTSREFFDDFIWKPYLFHQEGEGLPAPEIRPWRVNLVTNYEFNEGAFSGLRFGAGYRWEDDLILGNKLNAAMDNLDPNLPIHGGSESTIDLWMGYGRPLNDRVDWDIQVNVKGVGDRAGLIPVSVDPDGQVAAMRVKEGARWELRNTFQF